MEKTKRDLLILVGSVVLSVLLLLPTFVSGLPDWWAAKRIRLGLDLKGGSSFVLSVKTEEAVKSQLAGIGNSVKAELGKERLGIVRAKPLTFDTLAFTLLSQTGLDRLQAYIRENFKELSYIGNDQEGSKIVAKFQISPQKAKEIQLAAIDQSLETIRNRVDQYGLTEPSIQKAGENRVNVQLPEIKNTDEIKRTIGSTAKLEFRLVSKGGEGKNFKNREGGGTINLEEEVLMTGEVIKSASMSSNIQSNETEVQLSLNTLGGQIFDRITGENVGRNLAILLDDVVQSAPRIEERISGGMANIHGRFTPEEAHTLAIVLRSGALAAPLELEEQRTVGASLGADSIKKGLIATSAGALCVVVFMIVYYRKCGIVSVVCLIANLLWLTAMLALFGGTLTLPGIAGLALTIGMAVDANIIIYERIREELKKGSPITNSVHAGFDKAHWTILDANITTLISAIILYAFGTGPIKGFAVTTSIGILTTVIAALFATKVLFYTMDLKDSKGDLSI